MQKRAALLLVSEATDISLTAHPDQKQKLPVEHWVGQHSPL